MISVQTNINSIVAEDYIRINGDFQSQTIRRLTSGYRINQSGDDAAGLAAANQYRNATAELTQGVRNGNDAISALQIIDGGLNNIAKMLDRLKTLATEGASDTFTGSYTSLQNEYTALVAQINRQADNINLGAVSSGYAADLDVHIGGFTADVTVALSAGKVDATTLGLTTAGTTMVDKTTADVLLGQVSTAVGKLSTVSGLVGTGQNNMAYAINLAKSQIGNFSAAESRIRDADMAAEAANLTKAQILQQAGMAALAQANAAPMAVLALLKG